MTTEPAYEKIKPKEEDDDSLKKVSSMLPISKGKEWFMKTSDEVTSSFEKETYAK